MTRFTMQDIKNKGFHVQNGFGKRLAPTISGVKAVSKKDIEKLENALKGVHKNEVKKLEVTNHCGRVRVNIKPLSVNDAWKGQRFKTNEYDKYSEAISVILPSSITIPEPPFHIIFKFGFSNAASDWDNPIKPLQDCIAKKYGFNDKLIYKGTAEKELVKKGQEYFQFEIKHYG